MDQSLQELVQQYGIYAVFALCTVEGDITLLVSGTMANVGAFGNYGFLKLFLAGTLGGMVGDSAGYAIGRIFHKNAQDYRFYQVAQPRVEKLIEKFGGSALIISKYIYGIRVAMCIFYGVAKMPFLRFLGLSAISCSLWAMLLGGLGYFFSGFVTSVIGDLKTAGFALFVIVTFGIIVFYVIERYWLSEKVESADPETIQRIEEKIHLVEEVAQEKFHDLSERLHLTREPTRTEEVETSRADDEETVIAKKPRSGRKGVPTKNTEE
jgi:membrane protein DedA with SNARE-associated domain